MKVAKEEEAALKEIHSKGSELPSWKKVADLINFRDASEIPEKARIR
jgi:hypothetical protein